MKSKLLIVGIVAILLVLAMVYIVPSDYYEVEHNDPLYAVQQRMIGEVTFADGTTATIGTAPSLFAVFHEGVPVTSFTWIFQAKASTPIGYEPYDSCVMNWAYAKNVADPAFSLDWRVQRWVPLPLTGEIIDSGTWNPQDIGPVGPVIIPVDSADWTEVCRYTIPLDMFTNDIQTGDYEIVVKPNGRSSFWGQAGTYEGPVQEQNHASFPGLAVDIQWVGASVSVSDWRATYIFS